MKAGQERIHHVVCGNSCGCQPSHPGGAAKKNLVQFYINMLAKWENFHCEEEETTSHTKKKKIYHL